MILGRKESFRFSIFYVDLERKTIGSKCCHLQLSTQPRHPWEREEVKWTGEKERKKQREMVDAWQRFFWQLKLFYFYLSVNCLLLIFFCCLICVDFFFFLLSFVFVFFVFFVILYLVFFLLILGIELTLSFALLFIVICLFLFIYLFIFTFMDFLGGGVILIALGTSSVRLIVFPLGGCLHRAPVSRTGIEG